MRACAHGVAGARWRVQSAVACHARAHAYSLRWRAMRARAVCGGVARGGLEGEGVGLDDGLGMQVGALLPRGVSLGCPPAQGVQAWVPSSQGCEWVPSWW